MKTSNYSVINRIIAFVEQVPIVGDANVDTFHFNFDNEWDGFAKMLVWNVDGNNYVDNIDANNEVIIRNEVYNASNVTFGVYGIKDDAILSTAMVYLDTLPSTFGQIGDIENLPDRDTWNVYVQEMLALVAEGKASVTECENILTQVQAIQTALNMLADNVSDDAEDVAEMKAQIAASIQEINTKIAAFDSNFTEKLNAFNNNATTKTNDFNDNASTKTTAFNQNYTEKLGVIDQKVSAFDTNYEQKLGSFNQNASDKTTAFDSNATGKTNTFNSNATSKTTAFDNNASSKTTSFNNNAAEKAEDFNDNAEEKLNEFNENAASYNARITSLENAIWHGTQAEYDAIVTKSNSTLYIVEEAV